MKATGQNMSDSETVLILWVSLEFWPVKLRGHKSGLHREFHRHFSKHLPSSTAGMFFGGDIFYRTLTLKCLYPDMAHGTFPKCVLSIHRGKGASLKHSVTCGWVDWLQFVVFPDGWAFSTWNLSNPANDRPGGVQPSLIPIMEGSPKTELKSHHQNNKVSWWKYISCHTILLSSS